MSSDCTVRLVPWGPRRPSVPRLLVFPHAGGPVHAAAPLADAVAPDLETWVVELPGRGDRWREPPVERWTSATAGVLAAIDDDRPTLFYGHSFGGRLAFEVALRAAQEGRVVTEAVVVSGCRSPDHPQPRPWMSTADDASFVEAVSRLGGLDRELAAHPRLLRMFLPALRAEIGLAERWSRPAGTVRLDVALTAFVSAHDPLADAAAVSGWQAFTHAAFDDPVLPCGHFLDDEGWAVLARRLRRLATEVVGVHV